MTLPERKSRPGRGGSDQVADDVDQKDCTAIANDRQGIDPLEHFFCENGEHERELRLKIYRSRDRAVRRSIRQDTPAAVRRYCHDAADVATRWVFRTASVGQLELVRLHLAALAHAANTYESMEDPSVG